MEAELKEIINYTDNESTAFPWWVIVDCSNKRQMCKPVDRITGPFFSRKAATDHLQSHSYNYHPKAYVYCMSGHDSLGYRKLLNLAGK